MILFDSLRTSTALLVISLFILNPSPPAYAQENPITIAFGSCLKQNKPQPVWKQIAAQAPDVFLFMGDNVYIDSTDPKVMATAYKKLGKNPLFKEFRKTTPILPIWNDHDYGADDAGKNFAGKQASKTAFLKFFGIPQDDPRSQRDGLYYAEILHSGDRTIQIILLDTRWFRDVPATQSGNADASILGAEQWRWLQEKIEEEADLHIIASSIQVIPETHKWEKWANFPAERQRLLDMIKRAQANVIILSGDRHLGEISILPQAQTGLDYELVEVTASGLNSAMGWLNGDEKNPYRMAKNYREDHFGLLKINWMPNGIQINSAIIDADSGSPVRSHFVEFPD
ncbi:MAG: alkaline phosphatase D family protein [Thiotrichales bacterium]